MPEAWRNERRMKERFVCKHLGRISLGKWRRPNEKTKSFKQQVCNGKNFYQKE